MFGKLLELFSPGKKSRPKVNLSERWQLEGRVGQGSMSRVFRAYDRKIGRHVCLKLLDKAKTARFEARFQGLQRPTEGAICECLKHKNIVTTFDTGTTTEGEQFLVMELIDGSGLNFLIETKATQLNGNRFNYLAQSLEGLAYIHERGYMHRDICPRNIMVNSQGVVKIIDFGLAIPDRPEFRRPGNRTGTANYMAPELIKRVATDPRVDIFAMGVTAFEMFTGDLPWEGSQSLQTMLGHLNNPGRGPRDVNPNLDETLCKWISKSIERDPRDRFQTANEMREAMLRLPKKDY